MKIIRSKEWFEKQITKEGDSEVGSGSFINLLPKKIIRLDDGMEFLLNESTGKYRIHLGIPHLDDPKHLHNEYSYERLMEHPSNKGMFKVADGTEDLESMKRDWIKRTKSHNDGHGNGEDNCDCGRE